ncbi:unnamed protein product [Ectocarpus sp. 4 AP-2014]
MSRWNPMNAQDLQAELKAAAAAATCKAEEKSENGRQESAASQSVVSISSSGGDGSTSSGDGSEGGESARVSGSEVGETAREATAEKPSGGGSAGGSSTAAKGKGKRKAATSSTQEQPGETAAGRKATRRPKPATEEEEIEADEEAYKRSLKIMERLAARQKKESEEFARKELHRRVNQPVRKRTSEQKKADDEAKRLWERLLDVPIRLLDSPIQTGSGGAVTERAASAVTERAPIQTGSGGDVAELDASAVTEAICNAGAELTPALTGVSATADAETVTGDARDGGVSGVGREKEHQQDEAVVSATQKQREFMLNWCPSFRKVSGLPRNNSDFDRLFVEAREKSVRPIVGRPGWQRR